MPRYSLVPSPPFVTAEPPGPAAPSADADAAGRPSVPPADRPTGESPAAAEPAATEPAASQVAPLKALAGLLLLLPFLLIPLFFLWYAGRDSLVEHSRLGRYHQVGAVVVGTAVEQRSGRPQPGPTSWVPRVAFRYTVAGATYQASRLTPLDRGGTKRAARRHIAPYHAGDRIVAWYDPEQPGQAFIERAGTAALTSTLLLPAPILALALWLTAGARSRRRERGGGGA